MKRKIYLLILTILLPLWTFAQMGNVNFNSGAYIVNLGQVPQTVGNSLKPYGLVYDLVINQKVPVYWAINPSKAKDGIDFTANSKSYKGSAFIIRAEYVTPAVIAVMNTWKAKGVLIDGPLAVSFSAPVYDIVSSFPNAVLDKDNGNIITDFYSNAGIPSSSYVIGTPANLTQCRDIYIMPHADPQDWTKASNYAQTLDAFIRGGGYFWAGCHAVSAMETLMDVNFDGTPDANYLTTNRLITWDNHSDGSNFPYIYDPAFSSDPIMQFMGIIDGATKNGSEQVFLPKLGSAWRASTSVAVYDTHQADLLAGKTPGRAAILAYGRAFGNSDYGMVMYEAAHDLAKSNDPQNYAAQRAMWNFLLMAGIDKKVEVSTNVPATFSSGQTLTGLSAVVTTGTGPFTYLWTSGCGGTFSHPNSANTSFTAPVVTTPTNCVIQVMVTDACGRRNLETKPIFITPPYGTLTGHLYMDSNGNGTQDPGEPNLPGIDVIVTDAYGDVRTATTNANGDWTTSVPPGTVLVDVDESDPQFPTGANQTQGTDPKTVTVLSGVTNNGGINGYYLSSQLCGKVYLDVNGNGAKDSGEPGIANIDVQITASNSTVITATTDSNGNYCVDVPAGPTTINVIQSDPDFPSGTVQTEGTNPNTVTVVAGVPNNAGTDGFYRPAPVTGHLFIDTNGNGVQESGEPNLANVTVNITDSRGILHTVSSDANGNWAVSVPPGPTMIEIDETDPDFPAGAIQTAGTEPTSIIALAGVVNNGGNNGYYLIAQIYGHLFIDTNGNGISEMDEPTLSNVDVKITDANGATQIVVTDADGNWTASVPPGSTTVDVQESDPQYPAGYTQTAGTDPSTVLAVSGVSTDAGVDGYYLPGPISGHLFIDTNGNGTQDQGEPNLANVDVKITDANGTFQIVSTDASGNWATTVPPGLTTVDVQESDPQYPTGYAQTAGTDPSTVVAVAGVSTNGGIDGYAPITDLAVVKTVNVTTPVVGANLTFTITATNNGPAAATEVIVNDVLQSGYTFVSATPSTGTWTAPNWTIGNLANGSSATLTIIATVKATGSYVNTAVISGKEPDPIPGNNTSTVSPGPTPTADLAILKTVNNPTPNVGANVTFTITATNNGPSAATGVTVSDPLPAGYTLVSATPSTGSWTAPNWTIGNLANGGNATLTIVATVKAVGPYANTAIITGNETDPNLSNNSSTVIPVVSSSTDISITKTVYNAVPPIGGTSVFTISVTNNSPSTGATNVVISDVLHANLVFQSYTASAGIYDLGTGAWTLASLAPAATATLTITVKVQGSADNTASLTSLDQVDTNPANNQSTVSVTVSGSSGGNGGGLESNGDLAGLIALRNFNRVKESTKAAFESPATMMNFTDDQVKAGLIQPASTLKGTTGLINYLPESGPFRSKAYVSTPSDLLEISNAREVVAVDYFNESSQRYGAILALTTDQGEVYNHTKLICDRLTGARLENSMNIEIGGKPFILTKLVQENGDIDYAVTFVTWTSGTGMTIDSRWHNEEYKPAAGSTVFNFQIWSVTIQSTVEMVQEVLARIESDKKVTYLNTKARNIPVVQVVAGTYSNGAISLELNNPAGAASVTVKGTFTRTELSDKESFQTTLTLDPAQVHQTIEVPVGTIYDAGFSVANPIDATRDALYFADGSWGLDFPEAGAVVTSYTLDPEPVKVAEGELALERNVTFKGQVRDYVSIFRGIRAGSRPVDLSGYNALRFEASGTGAIEVVVTKASVQGWSQQFRTQIFLEPSLQSYDIEFEKMISGSGFTGLNAGDVESVVFSMIGNGSEWRSSEMELKYLKLINKETGMGALSLEDFRLGNYPNPLTTQTQIQFELPEKGKVTLSILDATGREIEVLASREFDKGKNYITWNASTVEAGIYLLRMKYNDMQAVKRMIVE